ncbi:MAG: hypothetical protein HOO91_05140 [Bacteroidales bacterium]|nr:hypothetical protein [Bacteroidales bacterium]
MRRNQKEALRKITVLSYRNQIQGLAGYEESTAYYLERSYRPIARAIICLVTENRQEKSTEVIVSNKPVGAAKKSIPITY